MTLAYLKAESYDVLLLGMSDSKGSVMSVVHQIKAFFFFISVLYFVVTVVIFFIKSVFVSSLRHVSVGVEFYQFMPGKLAKSSDPDKTPKKTRLLIRICAICMTSGYSPKN